MDEDGNAENTDLDGQKVQVKVDAISSGEV